MNLTWFIIKTLQLLGVQLLTALCVSHSITATWLMNRVSSSPVVKWPVSLKLKTNYPSPLPPVQVVWCVVSAVRWPITQETAAWQQAASPSPITLWSAAATAAPRGTASSPPLSTWAGAFCVPEVSSHKCTHLRRPSSPAAVILSSDPEQTEQTIVKVLNFTTLDDFASVVVTNRKIGSSYLHFTLEHQQDLIALHDCSFFIYFDFFTNITFFKLSQLQ